MADYIMALDAGTTSNRCILFNDKGGIAALCQKEFTQLFPKPAWVEHDPEELFAAMEHCIEGAIASLKAKDGQMRIAAIGIANQRETAIVWERATGKPLYNAIVWQCRRTAHMCDELKQKDCGELIRKKTGLVIDAYFSATKIAWILDNVSGARQRAERGELCFGTVDTWLMWKLSNGNIFATDYSNASRTMLYNITKLDWDEDILRLLNIPRCMLPEVKPSSGFFGMVCGGALDGVPIAGAAGDQQAALFGQCCFDEGQAKNTYGTGCFLLMNTGEKPVFSKTGLVTTVAWGLNGKVSYALEGSVFVAGAAVQWLRDELNIITAASETEAMAKSVSDSGGCYFVPAFTGLGAPYWQQYARGTIVGLSRGTNKCHITRAALESICYMVNDVLAAMEQDSGLKLTTLKVDGGAAANGFLMQRQADIINAAVMRPGCLETTALGAAYLAGLGTGIWQSVEDIKKNNAQNTAFVPQISGCERKKLISGWKRAVNCAVEWAQYDERN